MKMKAKKLPPSRNPVALATATVRSRKILQRQQRRLDAQLDEHESSEQRHHHDQ